MVTPPLRRLSVFLLLAATVCLALAQPPQKRWLVNGDFDDSPPGQPPLGWKPAYPTGSISVVKDEKGAFLRLTSTAADNAGALQLIAVPGDVKSVSVLGRMRGKPKNEKTQKKAAVEVALRYFDAKGEVLGAGMVTSENSPNWRTFRRDFDLPAGCVKIEVVARSLFAIGQFDFDEVRVEYK